MSHPSGTRAVQCPICKQSYQRTNWMRRSGTRAVLHPVYGWLLDTHRIACAKGHVTQTTAAQRQDTEPQK
jgi:hypothetical protein